jgi:hypothetical protein
MFPLDRVMERPKLALISVVGLVALAVALPQQVLAIDVVVDGTTYDVTIFSGSYNNNRAKFNTPPSGVMPWFGSDMLATQFALALGTSLGTIGINRIAYPLNGSNNYGGLFPTRIVSLSPGSVNVFGQALTSNLAMTTSSFFTNGVIPRYWVQAVAKVRATAVPGPLPLVGMALAYGYSRKVRSRIRSHGSSVGNDGRH